MKHITMLEKYPVYTMELPKNETACKNVDEIIAYFETKIEANETAVFIAIFDHYTHTKNLPNGEIAPEILDAKNIIFCFGVKIPDPKIPALRPRSIGVSELADRFVISFMEAPQPGVTDAMIKWSESLKIG